VVPAPEDGDSPESPIASVIFGPGGTRSFMYNGDVSVPQGDAEDWIAFRPYADHVFLSLECTGSNSIEIQILENRSLANTDMKCGIRMESLAVDAGMDYVIHLKAVPAATALEYVNYILTVNTRP
jgi:hypothetical protein